MAIVEVEEHWEREGEWNESDHNYRRLFNVVSDDKNEYISTILGYTGVDPIIGIPYMYSTHPGDSSAYMVKKTAKLLDSKANRFYWRVTCSYKYIPGAFEGVEIRWPWDLPPQVDILSTKLEVAADMAWGKKRGLGPFLPAGAPGGAGPIDSGFYDDPGDPVNPQYKIRNSAGHPFDPAVMRDLDHVVIHIQRAERDGDVDLEKVSKFRESINISDMTICGFEVKRFEGRMIAFDIRRQWTTEKDPTTDEAIPYYAVSYQIEIDKTLHTKKPIDQGFYELSDGITYPTDPKLYPSAEELRRIVDAFGKPYTEPSLLNGEGKALEGGDADPVFFQFLAQVPLEWTGDGGLSLPVDMPS